ncbi:hypothetical protein NCTGTJJY_CDS0228 [Serratia phage 92A1]|nr:hypothetical protein NCTGTJJY_CDS0228 [Serratia phage 92A1]
MNFTNFERKYVVDNAWDNNTTLLWKHTNGTVAQIDEYLEDNYVFISFENGPTLDVKLTGSVIKIGFHDDVRTRDLSYHPAWISNRELLIKLYMRHVLSSKTTEKQREAIWDIVKDSIKF